MNTKKNIVIYIVEDELNIAELLKFTLETAGYNTQCFNDAESAMRQINIKTPHLIVLDLMLPNMSGLSMCNKLKSTELYDNISILMLSAKNTEDDIVKGFDKGADDYITKPFSPKIFLARIEALLKRHLKKESSFKQIRLELTNADKKLVLNLAKHECLLDESRIKLTKSEFEILQLLSSKPSVVFSRTEIIEAIRGKSFAVTNRAIDFQIVGLRKKIAQFGDCIKSVRGIGYKIDVN